MRTTSHVIGYPSWLGKLVTTWWMVSIFCCHTCLVLSGRLGSTWWWRVLLLTSPQVKGACRDCVCRNTHHSSLIIIAVVGHCDLVWIVGVFDHWGEVARFGLLLAWSICHLLLLYWELVGDRIFLITVIQVAFGHFLQTIYLKNLSFLVGKRREVSSRYLLYIDILRRCADPVGNWRGAPSFLIIYHGLLLLLLMLLLSIMLLWTIWHRVFIVAKLVPVLSCSWQYLSSWAEIYRTFTKSASFGTLKTWWRMAHVMGLTAFTLCRLSSPLHVIVISWLASSGATVPAGHSSWRPIQLHSDPTLSCTSQVVARVTARWTWGLPRLGGALGVTSTRRWLPCSTSTWDVRRFERGLDCRLLFLLDCLFTKSVWGDHVALILITFYQVRT